MHKADKPRFLFMTFLFMLFAQLNPAFSAEEKIKSDEECIRVVLFPRREAVLSAEVSSRVTDVLKEMGEVFDAGTSLVKLDSTVIKARAQRAEADLKMAEVQIRAVEKLYKDNSRSMLELMQARREYALAKSNSVIANRELTACNVRAPYAGRVVQVFVNAEELVQAGRSLVSIVDDTVLRARFFAPSSMLKDFSIGKQVDIELEGGRSKESVIRTGKITHVSAVVDAASGTVEVYAEVDNKDNSLLSGMVGRLCAGSDKGEK